VLKTGELATAKTFHAYTITITKQHPLTSNDQEFTKLQKIELRCYQMD